MQLATEHGPKAGGLDGGADGRGDRLGDRVSLLAGEAALLDREGGRVAHRVDVGHTRQAAVGVDGNEAGAVGADAGNRWSVEQRQAHDPLGLEAPLPPIEEHGAVPCLSVCRADEGDALGLEHRVDGTARSRPADGQRLRLWRDEPVPGVVDPDRPAMPRGHDRELVERQRPRRAARDHERHPAHVAPLEICRQPRQCLARPLDA